MFVVLRVARCVFVPAFVRCVLCKLPRALHVCVFVSEFEFVPVFVSACFLSLFSPSRALSLSLSLSCCVSERAFESMSMRQCECMSTRPSAPSLVHPGVVVRPYTCLFAYLSVCLSVCMSACLPACLLPACLPACLPVCLSVCLSVYLHVLQVVSARLANDRDVACCSATVLLRS